MHSALMWHLSQNFQDLYSKDLKAMETYKKNTWNTAYAYTHALTNKDFYEVLSLRFYTVFQLMQSNYLKCESESTALGFLFHYTRVMNGKQITKASFAYITDFLAQGLRYQYVDTSKILSALRDNEHLRASKIFNARVQEEFLQRAVLPHSHILLQLSQVTSRKCIQDFPRHHYDPSKLSQEGRRKYESKSSPQSKQQQLIQQGSVFVDELMTWLRTSKHAKKDLQESNNNNPSQQQAQSTGDFYVRQEIMKLQALYYEERRKCSDLQVTVSRLEKRNQELERLLGQDDQWKYGVTGAGGVRSLRRSLSNNDLQNRGRQQQAGYYSPPPPKQNRVISNNEILAAANKQSRGAAAAANNSYDQSMFYSLKNSNDSLFNQTARYQQQLGGSTAKADKKLITNQYADISRLLHRIDRLSPKNAAQAAPQKPYIIAPAYRQTNSNENVPYYRQNRGAQKNEEGECLIF